MFFIGKAPTEAQLSVVFAFAAGVMMCVSVFDVMVPQLTDAASPAAVLGTLCSCCAGVGLALLAEACLPSDVEALVSFFGTAPEPHADASADSPDLEGGSQLPTPLGATSPSAPGPHLRAAAGTGPAFTAPDVPCTPETKSKASAHSSHWRLAAIMFLTLTLHNLPEGVAVALSSTQAGGVGASLAIAVAVHNIPEGLAISVPVLAATGSRWAALAASLASGLTEPLGALLTLLALPEQSEAPVEPAQSADSAVRFVLAAVAGVMLAVTCTELIPAALAKKGVPRAYAAAGFVAGAVVVGATLAMAPPGE